MDITYLLKKRKWQPDLLLHTGFSRVGDMYTLRTELADTGLDIVLTIRETAFTVQVLDPDLEEPYVPFETPSYDGPFVSTVRERAFAFVEDIIDSCSESTDLRSRLLAYVKETYGTEPEQQWKKYPKFLTLRNPSGKWYGLIMTIPWASLGLTRKGEIVVINLKLPPEEIEALTDHERYFPAYHMNKKYWLTVLLEGGAPWEDIRRLVDESYGLTAGRAKKASSTDRTPTGPREWLIPSNLKYYDLIRAFRRTDTITWHYHVDLHVGDFIYMYVTAPHSAILYKCIVTETGLKPDEKGRKRFRMKCLQQYPKDLITVDIMRACGSGPVRSERSVPEGLRRKIKELTGNM